jgi:hypothetical protein
VGGFVLALAWASAASDFVEPILIEHIMKLDYVNVGGDANNSSISFMESLLVTTPTGAAVNVAIMHGPMGL